MKKILITGASGFIGYHLIKNLTGGPFEVTGVDNLLKNHDYLIKLKRLEQLGLDTNNLIHKNFTSSGKLAFIKADLLNKEELEKIMTNKFDLVIHLAAQTGVRQSSIDSQIYIDNNISGFNNLLESCRNNNISKLIYASSSSVYGMHENIPSTESDPTDHPTSIYAVTKKTCELLAATFVHQSNMSCAGLRFFTVYGPWCRTDMAAYIFMKAIMERRQMNLYNYGDMLRDFTYVGDVCHSIKLISEKFLSENFTGPFHEIFNIGNRNATTLEEYMTTIEDEMGLKALYQLLPMQEGEVHTSYADTNKLDAFIGFKPDTPLKLGVKKMVEWFIEYYNSALIK